MTEEITITTTMFRALQTKVDQLEAANMELKETLSKQNEAITERLDNFNFQRSNTIIRTTNREDEAQLSLVKEDPEQTAFIPSSKVDKEDEDELTIEKSIHNLPLLNFLGIVFPIVSAVAYLADAILFVIFHNADNDKQKNYAGLISTILIIFFYLHYDVKFNHTHRRLYILYLLLLWLLMFSGDVIYVYYYHQMLDRPIMPYFFVCYAIIDTVWICLIGYLKLQGYPQCLFIITIENLFHLMAMVGQLLIIFIPIFGSHEVITTNSMAFIILYEFLSLSYTKMLDLKYSRLSGLCLWLLIVFSTLSIGLEYFVYAFEQLVEEKGNETSTASSSVPHGSIARYFTVSREISELLATIACYSLLVLQFFIKKDRKNK